MDAANTIFPINKTDKSPVGKNNEMFNNLINQLEAQKISLLEGKVSVNNQDRVCDLYESAYNKLFEASLILKEAINYK